MVHDQERGNEEKNMTCTDVGKGKTKEKEIKWGTSACVHYNHFGVAQKTKWMPPFKSLDLSAPKSYMAWPPLNLQKNV